MIITISKIFKKESLAERAAFFAVTGSGAKEVKVSFLNENGQEETKIFTNVDFGIDSLPSMW